MKSEANFLNIEYSEGDTEYTTSRDWTDTCRGMPRGLSEVVHFFAAFPQKGTNKQGILDIT